MTDKQATDMDSAELEALFDQTAQAAAGAAAATGAAPATGDSDELEALFNENARAALPATPAAPDSGAADSSDNDALEALFDQTARAAQAEAPATADSEDLEALFDQTAKAAFAQAPAEAAPTGTGEPANACCENIHSQLGHMTRRLHDTLHELGYDKSLERTAQSIPDAQQRLQYIATMTEAAANRALNAIESAQPVQEQLAEGATQLSAAWERMMAGQLDVTAFRQLVNDTRAYLTRVPELTRHTNAQLMEIMMAQDFQDLTGQVIKKTTELAQQIEADLLRLLVEFKPGERSDDGLLNGPVINGAGRSDVVMDQTQADELLESLGF